MFQNDTAMTAARWTTFYKTVEAAGSHPKGMDVSRANTLQFVDRKVGMGMTH